MYNSKHSKFIRTSLINILKETADACSGIGDGIETQSISEYIFQTTFLKMTGASEQKLKCICWDLATNDYEYRYQFLKQNHGECSSYTDKNNVYKDLCGAILKLNSSLSFDKIFDGSISFENVQKKVDNVIENSLLLYWDQHGYLNFKNEWSTLSKSKFAIKNALLCEELKVLYLDVVYKHRNRCAHNLKSYQENLPSFNGLCSNENVYNNYYVRFLLLVLIDDIFRCLYETYVECIDFN